MVKKRKRGRQYKDPIVGQKFGKLLVMKRLPDRKQGARNVRAIILCQCDCGKRVDIPRYYVMRKGNPRTHCGCELSNSIQRKFAPEYGIWKGMQTRCYVSTHISYPQYGALGVRICVRWLSSFEDFLEDMGPRPTPFHSIDRKNPKGNYEPKNCRWATATEQAQNKR